MGTQLVTAAEDRKKLSLVLEQARMYIDREEVAELSSARNQAVLCPQTPASGIRMVHLRKIVYNEEAVHAKLMSVYQTLSEVSDLVFLMICGHGSRAELYLGVRADRSAALAESALHSSLSGNFPGTEYKEMNAADCKRAMENLRCPEGKRSGTVVSVSQVPSCRGGEVNVQGIEHFIDAMKGQTYTAVFLAAPLTVQDARNRRNSLENLYSALCPLEKYEFQYSENRSYQDQHSMNESISDGITRSVTEGYNYATNYNSGISWGRSSNLGTQFSGNLNLGGGRQNGGFNARGNSSGTSFQNGRSSQQTRQVGMTTGFTETQGNGRSLSVSYLNKAVSDMLQRLEEQIQRLRRCEAFGLWEACAYFTAPAPDVALVAANHYKALVCGEGSGVENAYVNIWDEQNPSVQGLLNSLVNARVPVFRLESGALCNAGTVISGEELPIMMGLPLKSVCGLTVQQMAAFGREVYLNEDVPKDKPFMRIGSIYHMGREENTPVRLNIDQFSAHTLVCGTTGVGKSTMMSMLLTALHKIHVKLLVVEPTKGEYKDLLGKMPGLQVFTTSPRKNRMLHLNPFAFNPGIHVLTHIDRIMEVFSVCWPMYAAQPAMLRECVEEAYIRSGWDLSNSVYVGEGVVRYPNFELLLRIIPEMIQRSHFVGETKGTYEGALLTRVAMLTNGVFGQVFNSSCDLSDEVLFEHDTVVDLSEVGSQETISLLMGILVVRLREYRMARSRPDNPGLRHVLVLEEAHNILQRSTQNNVEGGESISGKSVKMLAQCIAEMRGYGQGIFIVDQSAGEIDISGIRNTATKIIMRQPEAGDKKAVAEALSLTPEQAMEISRLPDRVAAVYQAGWAEPVLVKFNQSRETYKTVNRDEISDEDLKKVRGFYTKHLLSMAAHGCYDVEKLKAETGRIHLTGSSKLVDFRDLFLAYQREYAFDQGGFRSGKEQSLFFSRLFTELLMCEDLFRICRMPEPSKGAQEPFSTDPQFREDCRAWQAKVEKRLDEYVSGLTGEEKRSLLRFLLLRDPTKKRWITVHNTLYGKVSR